MTALLEHLESVRSAGRKIFVPYLMAGVPDPETFTALLSLEEADAIEVGLPFSDPLMDGPVIAAAGERAIADGIGPLDAIDLVAGAPKAGPLRLVMTYYNPIHHLGEEEFCGRLVAAGISGLIVPDLPVEESGSLMEHAAADGLAWVPLVAPTSSAERVQKISATATGFVYAVSTMGVTGVRESLSERSSRVVEACRVATDLPVLVGIGVSTPEQAVEAASSADGVVIGSAIVKRTMEEGRAAVETFFKEIRAALG